MLQYEAFAYPEEEGRLVFRRLPSRRRWMTNIHLLNAAMNWRLRASVRLIRIKLGE